jgi:hypothetical protein
VTNVDDADLHVVELTDREREFISKLLLEWSGSASRKPPPLEILGLPHNDPSQFGILLDRLDDAVTQRTPLSDLDWARAMFLTEITWASSLLGAGADFETITGISDDEGIHLLRGLQRKIGRGRFLNLLYPNRS